jgi:hypothetical protein
VLDAHMKKHGAFDVIIARCAFEILVCMEPSLRFCVAVTS